MGFEEEKRGVSGRARVVAGRITAPGGGPEGRRAALPAPLSVALAVLVVPALLYTAIIGGRLDLKKASELRAVVPEAIERTADGAGTDGSGTDGENAADAGAEATGATVTAHAEFTSVFAKDEEYLASEDFTWDDGWFFADPATYNHDLARACASLSSVANAESEHYMLTEDAPDFMREVLAQLGFEYATTSTYEYRSAIVDQLAELIKPAGGDVTAYTIASKHVTDPATGQNKLLVIAVLRGTYGPEWLSNLRAGVAEGRVARENSDHAGFSAAAQGLIGDVFDYINELGDLDPSVEDEDVTLLLCGHSRGGAVANLAAAAFDDFLDAKKNGKDKGDDAGVDEVCAYTFATPGTTRNSENGAARYGNIFNICNPADLIPQTPLSAWGYARYGNDLWLPEQGSVGFDALYRAVCERFRAINGCETAADPADAAEVAEIVREIGETIPTIEDFSGAGAAMSALGIVTSGHDLGRIIQSHSPELYFSWLETIEAPDLRESR